MRDYHADRVQTECRFDQRDVHSDKIMALELSVLIQSWN